MKTDVTVDVDIIYSHYCNEPRILYQHSIPVKYVILRNMLPPLSKIILLMIVIIVTIIIAIVKKQRQYWNRWYKARMHVNFGLPYVAKLYNDIISIIINPNG